MCALLRALVSGHDRGRVRGGECARSTGAQPARSQVGQQHHSQVATLSECRVAGPSWRDEKLDQVVLRERWSLPRVQVCQLSPVRWFWKKSQDSRKVAHQNVATVETAGQLMGGGGGTSDCSAG